MRISDELKPWRCARCGNLLMRLDLQVGTVESKCGHCNTMHLRESSITVVNNATMLTVTERSGIK